jgi:hypothetical protein
MPWARRSSSRFRELSEPEARESGSQRFGQRHGIEPTYGLACAWVSTGLARNDGTFKFALPVWDSYLKLPRR